MKFKTFLTIHTVTLVFFGLSTLLIAPTLWGLYGYEVDEYALVLTRMLGGLMSANALLSWLFRDVKDSAALRAIIYQQILAWTVTFIVFIMGQLDGKFLPLGWSNVILAGVFVFAWVFYGFIKPITKD